MRGGRRPSSLRRQLRRYFDAMPCSFLKRMGGQIDLRNQRLIAVMDRISDRLLITTFQGVNGQEVDPVSTCARHPCRILQARIERVRVDRLTQVQSLSADVNGNRDDFVLGRDVAGEQRARSGSTSKNGLDTYNSEPSFHVNLLRNSTLNDPLQSFATCLSRVSRPLA